MPGEDVSSRGLSLELRSRLRSLTQALDVRGILGWCPLPVLTGPGRGLRVRAGDSNIRIATRGEPRVEAALLDALSPGDVFYDIGANIGWYSLLAARRVGRAGSVVAFEPLLENAHFAELNASGNEMAQVTVVPVALTDEDGWMPFLKKGSLCGRLAKADSDRQAQLRARRDFGPTGQTLVPVTTLDAWLAQTGHRPPTVVKIDVEGAELGVLRGMRETLAAARPTLIIELHATREDIAGELDSNGYEHFVIESELPTRRAPPVYGCHVLATPSVRSTAAEAQGSRPTLH